MVTFPCSNKGSPTLIITYHISKYNDTQTEIWLSESIGRNNISIVILITMSSSSSFRIGRRTASTGRSHESGILRSLFELRKRCKDHSHSTSSQEVVDLTFFNCQWTQRIINSLSKLIVRDGHRFSTIKFFDCEITNPKFVEIISMILKQNATTTLVIKGRKLVSATNESNGQVRSPLCESSTSTTSSSDESFLHAIREGISTSTRLESLKLSGMRFMNTIIRKTCDSDMGINGNTDNSASDDDHNWCHTLNNKSLLHLDLSGSYFSKSTISGISKALSLNTTLQSVKFGDCCLDDRSLSQILQSVKEHPSLTKLDLSRNFLAKSASTNAVNAVAELLKSKQSNLESLDLSNQQSPGQMAMPTEMEESEIEERHKTAFGKALDALSKNDRLQRINLSGNSGCFADLENIRALSSCLASNTSLCYVDVSSCHINPTGISYMAQKCIPRCSKKLKSLVLFDNETSNNSITKFDDWADIFQSLERGLQFNSTLESLGELDDIGMKFESRSSLQYLLNENRAGRRALQTDDLPLAVWPDVLARAGRIEYDGCQDDENDDDRSEEVQTSLASVTSASVLFALLHGPVMLQRQR